MQHNRYFFYVGRPQQHWQNNGWISWTACFLNISESMDIMSKKGTAKGCIAAIASCWHRSRKWSDDLTTKDLALSDPAHYSAEQVWIVSNRLGNADFHVDQCLYVICVSVFVRGWARMLVRAFHFLKISVPNGLLHWFSYYVYANSGFWYPYVTFLSWKISYFWKTCKKNFWCVT